MEYKKKKRGGDGAGYAAGLVCGTLRERNNGLIRYVEGKK